MRGYLGWFWRIGQVLVGTMLIASAGALVFTVAPQALSPGPGDRQVWTEDIEHWTPETGWQDGVRTHTLSFEEDPRGLVVSETIQGPHSPRGDRFSFLVDPDMRLLAERGLRSAFPPTPYLQDPATTLHLAVPWEAGSRTAAAAIDNLTVVDETTIAGVDVLEYHAEHGEQFWVEDGGDGTIWYRSVERTVFVEPLTGTVIHQTLHETLWADEQFEPQGNELPGFMEDAIEPREKVWEATIETTAVTQRQQADRAEDARSSYHWQLALTGLPPLLVGEIMIFRAMATHRGAGKPG